MWIVSHAFSRNFNGNISCDWVCIRLWCDKNVLQHWRLAVFAGNYDALWNPSTSGVITFMLIEKNGIYRFLLIVAWLWCTIYCPKRKNAHWKTSKNIFQTTQRASQTAKSFEITLQHQTRQVLQLDIIITGCIASQMDSSIKPMSMKDIKFNYIQNKFVLR